MLWPSLTGKEDLCSVFCFTITHRRMDYAANRHACVTIRDPVIQGRDLNSLAAGFVILNPNWKNLNGVLLFDPV